MISVNTMGLELKNPIIVSAGPWTRGHNKIVEALKSGAAAVVTESIVSEPYPDVSPRYAYNGRGLQNIRMYSGLDMDGWLKEFQILEENNRFDQDGLIIANIMASTPSELSYIAGKFERAGADALELGLACPMGEGPEVIAGNPEKVYSYTKEAVDSVDIPVMVKLTQSTSNLSEVLDAIKSAGASGITGIDTIRCILSIDTDTGRPILPTYGGYSGGPIRPMGLAMIASAAQSTDLPIFGIGGIESYKHALEYMMLGASACEVGSAVIVNGYNIITEIINDLDNWFKEKNISSIDDIRGISLKELHSFEEIKVEPNKAFMKTSCSNANCMKCIRCCLDYSISMIDNHIEINKDSCTGCALCVDICPENKINMEWEHS